MHGGESIFWADGVQPVDEHGIVRSDVLPQRVGPERQMGDRQLVRLAYPEGVRLKGAGNFRLDFLIYHLAGVDLGRHSSATLHTLELFPKIILPFLVMVLCSLFTRRNTQQALDRYYAKMKMPVVPDRAQDQRNLASAYADPQALESKKLFPGTDFEFQRATPADVWGFVICLGVCFAIIGAAFVAARLGA